MGRLSAETVCPRPLAPEEDLAHVHGRNPVRHALEDIAPKDCRALGAEEGGGRKERVRPVETNLGLNLCPDGLCDPILMKSFDPIAATMYDWMHIYIYIHILSYIYIYIYTHYMFVFLFVFTYLFGAWFVALGSERGPRKTSSFRARPR